MSNQAQFGVAIVAEDQTAKGVKSAEKRIGQIPKHTSAVNRRAMEEDQRRVRSSAKAIVNTFGKVEKAGAKLFGGKSVIGGLTSRMGALGEVASSAGSGLAEASAAGGLLEGTLVGVGAAAATTVGVLVAAAAASWKFADGWAKGASSIGRTAAIIGVGTKALQEFQGAAERIGVDKGAAGSAIGGLSETLNDARYGRNVQALAVLQRLGVGLKLNKDGTVDVAAMLPAIADAMARQNSSGRRTAARALGINEAAIPVFAQGGKALSADMRDYGKRGAVVTQSDIAMANKIQRRDVELGQRVDRGVLDLQRGNAEVVKCAGDVLSGGAKQFDRSVTTKFAPGAEKMDQAASRIAAAANGGVAGAGGFTGNVIAAAQAAEKKWGVPAAISLAQYQLESGNGRHMPAGSNNPFGIKARAGDPFVWAMTTEQDARGRSRRVRAKFRVFSSMQEAFEEHAKLLATGRPYASARRALPDLGAYADALTGHYATDRNYGAKLRGIMESEALAAYDGGKSGPIPVEVTVHIAGHAPPGTRATVKAGTSRRPAISHAFIPVHGG